jgi:dCMP deaminase
MKTVLIAYIPVLHSGYIRLFNKYPKADIYIFGTELVKEFDYLRKEIRALDPEDMKQALEGLGRTVYLLGPENLQLLSDKKGIQIVMPREDVTEQIAHKYLPKHSINFEPLFLRWNRENVEKEFPVGHHEEISLNEMLRERFNFVLKEADKTSDWWLQVGALIEKDGEVVLAGHNRYNQSPHQVWSEGDPRNAFFRGVNIELSTSLHAERGIIAEAAKRGISLEGTTMYVTHFPCPMCAKMIATSGIKKLYYATGYAVLDGESALEQSSVEIIKVKGVEFNKSGEEYIPYIKE